MSIGLLGKKIGMTSIYDANGKLRPVTVIAAGDNTLLRRVTSENDGYSAVQVGFDAQKESRVHKAAARRIHESRLRAEEIRAGISSRGRMRRKARSTSRHAVSAGRLGRCHRQVQGQRLPGRDEEAQLPGQGASHGSKTHRRNGAIGNRSTPGRIWKNMGMPGHMGDERVTVQNLQVLQVREDGQESF